MMDKLKEEIEELNVIKKILISQNMQLRKKLKNPTHTFNGISIFDSPQRKLQDYEK